MTGLALLCGAGHSRAAEPLSRGSDGAAQGPAVSPSPESEASPTHITAHPARVSAHPVYVPGQVVVRFEGDPVPEAVALPDEVSVPEAVRALGGNPDVAYAVPNYVATASAAVPNDPGTVPGTKGRAGGWTRLQWNFLPCGSFCGGTQLAHQSRGGIDALGAWHHLAKAGRKGASGVTVAVLDTGIAYRSGSAGAFRRSPDFARAQFTRGYDFVRNDPLPLDENGHGTHVAGTIGERTGNRLALTGLAFRAKLMPVRVLNARGRGQSDDIARGIRYAAARGADVINMSFNFSCGAKVKPVADAVRYAVSKGAVLVASAGNLGTEACVSPPATFPGVIGVNGTTEGGCLGDYSLSGADIDLAAPGGGTPSGSCLSSASRPVFQLTLRPGSTSRFAFPRIYAGTSMAAAHVSGTAAMVIASGVVGRSPAPAKVLARLRKTARDLGIPGKDTGFGSGLIDAGRATDPTL